MATPSTRGGVAILLLLLLLPLLSVAMDDSVHLLEFKESLKSTTGALDDTWLPTTEPCDLNSPWLGVECNTSADGRRTVSSLSLINCGLTGSTATIDVDALSGLESLRFLSLENNSLAGPLPEFDHLAALRSLFLSGNAFSGEIPPDYFTNMIHLRKLDLSRNSLSGNIPVSLADLNALNELYLQHNQFSGPVPNFRQKSLQKIDLSYNKLEGEVPRSLSRFPADNFQGNPDLCGGAVYRVCPTPAAYFVDESHKIGQITKWVILAIVVIILLSTILSRVKNKDQDDALLMAIAKEKSVEDKAPAAVEVHMPTLNRKFSTKNSGRWRPTPHNDGGSQSSIKAQCTTKSSTELIIINDEKGVFAMADLMKAAAEVLGTGGLGLAYKARLANGLSVVVKRSTNNKKSFSKDEFTTEARKLGRVRHRNILPLLACSYQKDERLIVTEYIPGGSLHNLLHGGRVAISWPTRLKIIKGVARGMGCLHTEFASTGLPHGNLKSSNILLSPNYDPLLTDYALRNLISDAPQALSSYRAPEVAADTTQISPKSDVYCFGVVILEIMTRKLPSQCDIVHLVHQAATLLETVDPDIASEESRTKMERILRIGAVCTETNPQRRMDMRETIRRIEEIQI